MRFDRVLSNPPFSINWGTADTDRQGQPVFNRRAEVNAQQQGFAEQLNSAVDALDETAAAALLLAILRNDMQAILERYIRAQRQQVAAAFENWWDKYRVTLTEIEQERASAESQLHGYFGTLRYV